MAKQDEFNQRISEELNTPSSFASSPSVVSYRTSPLREETYSSLEKKDLQYEKFITRLYGSYENFLKQSKIYEPIDVFDPTRDYHLDVTVVSESSAYKSDHMSPQEMIMELLNGVCTVWFTKVNGQTRRLTCTLQANYLPSDARRIRGEFFSPMFGDRIGVWELNEQTWKSFYMNRVFKMVRDDSTSLE